MLPAMKSWPMRVSHLFALPLILLGLWLFPTQPALAADCTGSRYFVNKDASGGNSGADWANAITSLQDALTAAASCPSITEIWVAEGLHTPGTAADDTFSIRAGLAVYGGFAGTESSLNQRDWESHVTVLSGDITKNDTVDANGVVTVTTNIVGPNAFHVVTMDGTSTPITANTRLDGFVITAGQAETTFTERDGGGFYCNGTGNGSECSPTLANIVFSGNIAEFTGGAMANIGTSFGKSNPVLNNVTFSGNMASAGGAMSNLSYSNGTSSPALNDVTFSNNKAFSVGGAMLNDSNSQGTSSPVLNRVIFSSNSLVASTGKGGAMYNDTQFMGTSSPALTDVTFTGNSAQDGGAMYSDCAGPESISSPVLNRVTFTDNTATRNGGAMLSNGNGGTCTQMLTNVVFLSNSAATLGGGMFSQGLVETFGLTLINVTLAGNEGTALVNDFLAIVTPTFTISNTIFYANDSPILNPGGDMPTIGHSLVQESGGSGGGWNNGLGFDGGGNMDANPNFVDGVGGDLRLRAGSPAIDAGINSAVPGSVTTDIAGAPRIFDGNGDSTATVDMGAHEFAFFPFNVAHSGSGSGTVSSVPAGINCGADCTETFNAGTAVALTATPSASSTFAGWSGACSGTGACHVTINEANDVTATFILKQYTIAASANVPGGGAVSGAGTVNHGDLVTLTAMSNIGYTFVNWTEDGTEVSTDPTYSFTATGNRTLVANFTLNHYAINLSADPAEGGETTGGGTVSHGATVVVTATPSTGYTFVNWTEGDTEVSTNASFVFAAMFGRTLVAHFSPITYTLSISAAPVEGGTVNGKEVVSHGEIVTVTATSNSGFGFVNWTEDGTEISTQPNYSFTVAGDRTLVANFSREISIPFVRR
ncbi:MAG: InlB B-repeat-containing protein [Caldilineaceae bacterium]|nr:InlB B-repeat-containing protein [Caldilineaceae bacterium]